MKKLQRTSPLSTLTFAAGGLAVGLLVQFARSSRGLAPFIPPTSLAATLLVVAGVLLTLAILLHRAVRPADAERKAEAPRKPVNPFHAVRLLAGARASQFAGALFAGFGGGLALQVLSRSVLPSAATWLPMLLVLVSGIALVVCGIIAERLCRVPPSGPDSNDASGGGDARSPSEYPA